MLRTIFVRIDKACFSLIGSELRFEVFKHGVAWPRFIDLCNVKNLSCVLIV